MKFPSKLGGVIAFVTLSICIASCTGTQAEDFEIGSNAQLERSVRTMYDSVLNENYGGAWDMRSTRCKEGYPRDAYASDMQELLKDYTGGDAELEYHVTMRAPGMAMVSVAFPESKDSGLPEFISTGDRLWSLESGRWVFDNCE